MLRLRRLALVIPTAMLIASLILTAALVGASLTTDQSTRAAPPQATASVAIENFAFSPASLTVPIGTTVAWTNMDRVAHTVTSDSGAWADSGSLAPHHTFSHTFTQAGTFPYHCAIHPFMVGRIIVSGAGSGSPHPGTSVVPVKLAPAHLLVTSAGLTLYVFARDSKGKSACYQACARAWPPLTVPSGSTVSASVSGIAGTFGLSARTDGTRQLTFDGAPLYRFGGDKKPGDLNGQGLFGLWWAVVAPPGPAPVQRTLPPPAAPTASPTATIAPPQPTATATAAPPQPTSTSSPSPTPTRTGY
jgi:predicted lipoprotein with Yx(FWY)xxD motif